MRCLIRDAWIIGSGLAGATCAYEFNRNGISTHVFEKDDQWGGLTRTATRKGVVYEPHGSHIFHTDDEEVWMLVNMIGPYNAYEHRVQTVVEGKIIRWPIMAEDLQHLSFGKEALEYINDRKTMEEVTGPDRLDPLTTDFESWCLHIMTPDMYEAFVKPYTEKQWGRPASTLSASFAPKRVQVRTDGDDRLFKDRFQGFPDATRGFTYEAQLRTMLRKSKMHLNSHVTLQSLITRLKDTPRAWRPEFVVVTVPLDDFCDNVHGELEWRGLDFSAKWVPDHHVQERMVVNWPSKEFPWIRTHETKHASGQQCKGTVCVTEFTGGKGRYYPVPGKDGLMRARNEKYADFVRDTIEYMGPWTQICGRLASFKYLDMDDVIRQSLDTVRYLIG